MNDCVALSTETAGMIRRVNGPSRRSFTSKASLYIVYEGLAVRPAAVVFENSY